MLKSNPPDEPAFTAAHLPQPRGNSRWRWSTPRKALVAGGAMATVLALGAGVAAASTSGSGNSASNRDSSSHGPPPGGGGRALPRPTVGGKVTALSGDGLTVQTQADKSVTVVYSSRTTFRTMTGSSSKGAPGTATSGSTISASALKVGDFVGVSGTKNANGSVTASSVTISPGPPTGRTSGGPPPGRGAEAGARPPEASA